MNIIIVRHGQTDFNLQRKIQGLIDNRLNENGKQQALITKQKLNKEKIDLIICSPLIRAVETADIINRDRNIPIIYDERIKERDFGEFEGVDINKEFKPYEFWSYKNGKKFIKAESTQDFFKRIYNFLDDIKHKYNDKDILLVAHAGVSIAVKCYINGIPEDDKLVEIRLKNCEFEKFEV